MGNEPDEAQSLVRFLTYTSVFQVEALVARPSTWQRNEVQPQRIHHRVDAYEAVRSNLLTGADRYPPADSLRQLVYSDQEGFGMDAVGPDQSSPGSRRRIEIVDRAGVTPEWILAWGGPNTLAQALRTARDNRSRAEVRKFVRTLRFYTIINQDDSGRWVRPEFPELFYILSPSCLESEDYATATCSGISGAQDHDCYEGADVALVSNGWLTNHI